MDKKKAVPERVVLFSDETRGHNHQSLGVARWVARLCGAEIYEIRVPSFSGLQRLRILKQQARSLGTASAAEIKEWLKTTGFPLEDHADTLSDNKETLYIATGNSSSPFCLALSRLFHGRSAVIMTPTALDTRLFDFAIVPLHDHPEPADNLITTLGAPNHIYYPELQAAAAETFAPLLPFPKKVVTLLLGGSDANYELTPGWVRSVLPSLRDAAEKQGAALLVTTSRRTGAEADAAVEAVFAGSPATRYLLLASRSPENPVPAMLGAATHVLVTEDSVSMASEAATAGFRVGLIRVDKKESPLTKLRRHLGGGTAKFDALFTEMAARGFVEDLGATPDFEAFLAPEACRTEVPFDEAKRAAEWILNRWTRLEKEV